MKQYITDEQFDELVKGKTFKEVSEMLNINLGDIHNEITKSLIGKKVEINKLITMGKLIEILGEDLIIITNKPNYMVNNIKSPYCSVLLWFEIKDEGKEFTSVELIDALYEAVKFILEEE